MAGRKRKPDHLKIVSGTAQPCRMNPSAPTANPGLPTPPAWLSERACELFNQVAATLDTMGIASPDHVHALAMLASRLEEIEITTAVIEDLGRTYTTTTQSGDQMFRTRPEVGQRNEALRHAQSLLAEFGLTPAALGKVSAPGKRDENPFAALG